MATIICVFCRSAFETPVGTVSVYCPSCGHLHVGNELRCPVAHGAKRVFPGLLPTVRGSPRMAKQVSSKPKKQPKQQEVKKIMATEQVKQIEQDESFAGLVTRGMRKLESEVQTKLIEVKDSAQSKLAELDKSLQAIEKDAKAKLANLDKTIQEKFALQDGKIKEILTESLAAVEAVRKELNTHAKAVNEKLKTHETRLVRIETLLDKICDVWLPAKTEAKK